MNPWIARRPRGFTLIELLIVITIISILIVILVAVARVPKDKVVWEKIRESLDQALRSYEQTFDGMYPPSNNVAIGNGAECLYYYLMGPNEKGWSPAASGGGVPANYTWGPAKELAEAWMVSGTSGGRKYFTDGNTSLPKPVLYYRADQTPNLTTGIEAVKYSDVYRMADNTKYFTPTAAEWTKLIVYPSSPSQAPFNPKSYILWGAGEDRQFGYVEGKCDDFANFKRPN